MKPTTVSAAKAKPPGSVADNAVAAVPCSRWRREILGNVMLCSCPCFGNGGRSQLAGEVGGATGVPGDSQALCHDRTWALWQCNRERIRFVRGRARPVGSFLAQKMSKEWPVVCKTT